MPLPIQGPLVITGASSALFIGGAEMPMIKTEIKLSSKLDESTGSTSIFGGAVWADYGAGPRMWTVTANGVVRSVSLALGITTGLSPLDIIHGYTYAMTAYVRRPNWSGGTDAGLGYWGNVIVEESPVPVFDPRSGGMEWSMSGKGQGPLNGPAVPPDIVPPPP
jgi:hypothetical protein